MKRIIFLLICMMSALSASTIEAPVLSVNEANQTLTIKVKRVDVGVSGFLVHHITSKHSSILKSVEVISYDAKKKKAILKMHPFTTLHNDALPRGKWKPTVGDSVVLASRYSRGLLIAPSEELYHRIAKSVEIEWVHPDIFAALLSYRGHPTPLQEDFKAMSDATGVGLLFIYLKQRVYTVDIKTLKILSISDAPLKEGHIKLPFYSRVEKIDANWWGEGSSRLKDYASYYFGLLKKYNPQIEIRKKDDR